MSCLKVFSTRLAVLPCFQFSWSSTLYAVHNVSSQTLVIFACRLFWNLEWQVVMQYGAQAYALFRL